MSDVQQSLNQVAKGASILLIGTILAKLINYFYWGYLARVLSVSEYGLLNLGIMIITFVIAVSTLGMEAGLNRYIPYYRGLDDKKSINGIIYFSLKVTLAVSILISLIIYFFSTEIARLFENSSSMASILMVLSISVPFSVVGVRILLNCLLYFNYIKEYSFIFNVLQHITRLLFTIVLISIGLGIFGSAIAYSLNAIAIGIISFYMLNFRIKIKKEKFGEKKDYLKYALPLFLVTIIGYMNGWIDTFMVGYLLDNYNVGIYNASFLISQLLLLFPNMILPLALPIIGPHFARGEIKSVEIITKQIAKWILAFSFFLLLILLSFPGTIIRIIFGVKYFPAIPALSILAIGFFISTLVPLLMVSLSLHKKTKLIFFNSLAALTTNIILNLILTPRFGLVGTAIATGISQVILLLVVSVENYLLYKINLFSASIAKITVSLIIPMSLLLFSKNLFGHNIPILSVVVFAALLIYLVSIFKLKVIDESDKEILKMFARRIGINIPKTMAKQLDKSKKQQNAKDQ